MQKVRILTARPHRLLTHLMDELKLHSEKEHKVLFLVPEQLTLTAEMMIMDHLQMKTMFNISVLSPTKLYRNLQAELGRDETEPLSAVGYRMAVSQTMENAGEKLPYFGANIHSRGFVEKLAALITDLKRGGMTPDLLTDVAAKTENEMVKAKFTDLALIFQRYEDLLGGRFSDNEDRLTYAARRLQGCDVFEGVYLYVYGFDTLPYQLSRLLAAAAELCEGLTIGLLADKEQAPDGFVYTPVRQGIERFGALLTDLGVPWENCQLPQEKLNHAPAIDWLDETLFVTKPKPYPEVAEEITQFCGMNPYDEATLMSRHVLELIRQGIPAEEILVMYPENSGYEFAVSAALNDAGIPFFDNRQLSALSHGLVRFLLEALRAMESRWNNRIMLPLIKNEYGPLTFEAGCRLQEYVLSQGYRRENWERPFERGGEALALECNSLREKMMMPLMKARRALLDAKSAKDSARAVYELLMDVGAYDKLCAEEEKLQQEGFGLRAEQGRQIWQHIVELLEETVRLGGNARIPLKHIATRMECGFSAVSLAALPPQGARLHTGILGHMLAEKADAVFLLGMNEGLLNRETQSLLQPQERAQAEEITDCFLGLTDRSRAFLAQMDLKRAVTLPGKKLYLSWAVHSAAGEELHPLALLQHMEHNIFPKGMGNGNRREELPVSVRQAANLIAAGKMAGIPDKMILSAAGEQLYAASRYSSASVRLEPAKARTLFGDKMLSVSRLESFASCPFRHYVQHGLKPEVPQEWKPDSRQTGNFYHDALNKFSATALNNTTYPNLPQEEMTKLVDSALEAAIREMQESAYVDGERNRAQLEEACNALRRAAEMLTQQLAAGAFRLYRTEAKFGMADPDSLPAIVLQLHDGTRVGLQGQIDRIDVCENGDETWVRVIDYKSSQKELDEEKVWYGFQLQLLLYLNVCIEAIPNSVPAGAFYFHISDPLVDCASDLKQVVEKEIEKQFHLKGFALSRVQVLQAMGGEGGQGGLSSMLTNSGTLKNNAKALDEEEMKLVMAHSRKMAVSLAEHIFDGDNEAFPMRNGGKLHCENCEFAVVCRYEQDAPGARINYVPSMKMEELKEKLHEQAEE